MSDKKEQITRLVELLNKASESYYSGNNELMSDFEWDKKFDELKRLESETGFILPDSPTQKVSELPFDGQKETHEYPALSLAKTKKVEDIVKWADGRKIWISWKLDGLTLVATYDDGHLTRLVTRGNGREGTNVTKMQTVIQGVPEEISYKGHLVVRGEAVISYSDFEHYLIESGEDYANPRNLASGTMTLHDLSEVKRRKVRWIPFTLVYIDTTYFSSGQSVADFNSWGKRMDWLETQGFNPVDRESINISSENNIKEVIDDFTAKVTSRSFAYPVDGLVVAYDDVEYSQTGSITGHHATRAGLAFKWQDETAETELTQIEWSCAANVISPVAVFSPVELEGTIVKRASLCNISECERLGIGGKGTKLEVIKANKIIPKVVKVTEAVGQFTIPEKCPACHFPTTIEKNESSEVKTLRCTNDKCPAKELKKISRFVSKEALNIDGLSEQTLQMLISQGWISEFSDIFHLSNHRQDMSRLVGYGEKSVTNLLQAIENSRNVEAFRLMYGLCIPLCGTEVCRRFLSVYKFNEIISKARETTDLYLFSDIDSIGPEKSAAVIRWMKDDYNYNQLMRLIPELSIKDIENAPTGGSCEGLTFVITGTLNHFENREALKSIIEQQGGKVVGSISNKTDYLINNDITSSSGKNVKAKELGVPIISEDDFISQYINNAVEEPKQTPSTESDNNKPIQMELF